MAFSETAQQKSQPQKKGEVKLRARAVSRGVAIGKIVCLHGKKRQFYRVALKPSQIEREIKRLHAAVRLAKRQLKKLGQHNKGETQASIFEMHRLLLEDKSLLTKIEEAIREQKVNAEWAVKVVTDRYLSIYKDIQDEHLRERRVDLEDVTERLQLALGGGRRAPLRLEKDSIIVAGEIKPSTLAELSENDLAGILTETGGWTSHSFIIAREIGLPAVAGLKGILRRVANGETVIVDGYNGQIVLNPTAATLRQYRTAAAKIRQDSDLSAPQPDGVGGSGDDEKVQTLDGRQIIIRANLDIAKGYAQARQFGARGIGLFRSEFLFNRSHGFPTENEQIVAYRKAAAIAGEDGVKIRTFDLSLEHLSEEAAEYEREKNPALGLRAVRLGLTHNKKQFCTQIRALLQAAAGGKNLDILLPMISDVAEIRQVKEIIRAEKARLKKKNIKFGDPKIGAMIEVPSAVLMAEEIAAEVDYLNLGTNDLVQYLLAVDRDNAAVAEWFRTLHPAVLRAVKKVIQAAAQQKIPLTVCGEMAGSPVYVPLLIGLGAEELSMNVNSIPRIRRIISNIAYEEAREITSELEACRTANEVESLVKTRFQEKWKHLFPPEIFHHAKK
jgi:phosphoenolpyruvate-protein phosphotransferase (PTS system enzyme I)